MIEGCALAAPCRGFIAKKVLEYGFKAGITTIVAKEIADNISSEDLDHLITLNMVGNDEITNRYLDSLADKYATTIATAPNEKAEFLTGSDTDKPIKNHTGDTEGLGAVDLPTNTGHGSGLDGIDIPSHTGDTEGLGSVTIPNNTGHDGGLNDVDIKNDTGGDQILDNSRHDNILTSQKPYEPNKGSVGNMGEFLGQSGFGSDVKDNSSKTSKQYQGQSIYTANKPIGDNIDKGDQFYLDGQHKNHIEVFNRNGDFKAVLNLDGTYNAKKTNAAQKRSLK